MQTQTETLPATLGNSNFSAADQISASDIVVPRLKVMQSNSDLVKEDKAKAGAIIDPDTLEQFAYKAEKPLEFVILASRKYWLINEGGNWFSKPANTRHDFPRSEAGVERTFFHSFLVVLKKDLQEKGAFLMPYQLGFSSTGLNAVSTISKIILQGKALAGKPSYAYYMKADVILRKKGQNSWFQLQPSKGADLTKAELEKVTSIPIGLIMEQAEKTDTKGTVQSPDTQEEY